MTGEETELSSVVAPTIVDPLALVPPVSPELKEHMNQKPAGGQTNVGKNKDANP